MNDSVVLQEIISNLESVDRSWSQEEINRPLDKLTSAIATVARSHGGSWLGWQALVYYSGFQPPPPGHHFSSEWGKDTSLSMFGEGTQGDWAEYTQETVVQHINELADNPDLGHVQQLAGETASTFDSAKLEIESMLRALISNTSDKYYESLLDELLGIKILRGDVFIAMRAPKRNFTTRDMLAVNQGIWTPPHCSVESQVFEMLGPKAACALLLPLAKKAHSYLLRVKTRMEKQSLVGTNVFIGHGRSKVWRDLKDFIVERMRLPYDEFNRVPVAGITNTHRLSEMLDAAAIAFVVMTAEDEQADGKIEARTNVIHEVGLFQGRLGFTKAIVLLEEGCEEFSNIQGLGQIRFPKGDIASKFEDIRLVLERERLIQS